MNADHLRNLGRVGKIETLPIFPICRQPSQTVGDVRDFEFSLVGKIRVGRETVKSPIVRDFPDIWKPAKVLNPTSHVRLAIWVTQAQLCIYSVCNNNKTLRNYW